MLLLLELLFLLLLEEAVGEKLAVNWHCKFFVHKMLPCWSCFQIHLKKKKKKKEEKIRKRRRANA